MKKIISLSVAVVIILSTALLFSGCTWDGIQVTSLLSIDKSFSGSRTVSFTVPKSAYSDNLNEEIMEAAPVTDDGSVDLESTVTAEGDVQYFLKILFYSQGEYIFKVKHIVGREVSVNLACPDNVMAKGTKLVEDFDTVELLSWLEPVLENDNKTFGMKLKCKGASVELDGETFETTSTVNVNSIEGNPIQTIKIYTKNNKDGTYDRTFSVIMDSSMYRDVGNSINEFFEAATLTEIATSFRWTEIEESQQYQVVYNGLDIQQLQNVTNSMLSVTDGEVSYDDTDNSSTPFIEGLAFDEKLNFNAYMGEKNGEVQIIYEYELPEETTHGTATALNKGIWEEIGQWSENVYSFEKYGNTVNISIKDGIEFPLAKIEYYLEQLGDDNFRRVMDIYYKIDEESQFSGAEYACSYFIENGADAQTRTEDGYEVCSLSVKGSAIEVSLAEAKLFGGGNYFNQTISDPVLDIRVLTEIRDYIYISPLLTDINKDIPVYYTVKKGEDYNVNYLKGSDSEEAVKNDDGSLTITIKNGVSDIYVLQSKPHTGKVVLYILLALVITAAAIFILRRLYLKGKRQEWLAKSRGEEEDQEFVSLSQLPVYQKGQEAMKKTRKKILRQGKAISDSRKKKQADRMKKRELEYYNDELYDEDIYDDFDNF